MHEDETGKTWTEMISVQVPFAMLYVACAECPPFAALLREAYAKYPSSPENPWNLVLYADEVGHNPLLPHDGRKVQCVYYSFLELGAAALMSENAWLIAATVRSSLVERIESGMSQFLRALLVDVFFNSTNGQGFQTTGLILKLDDGSSQRITIFARVRFIAADEKALKEVSGAKGASGFKMCAICSLVTKHHALPRYLTGNYVPSTELDMLKFGVHTDESLRAMQRELVDAITAFESGVMTKSQLENIEYHFGYTYLPGGLYSDVRLAIQPRQVIYYDWYHIYVVNGVYQKEIQALLTFLGAQKFPHQRFAAYLGRWSWPRSVQSPCRMFDDYEPHKDHLTCDGHVCTSSYEVIATFITSVIMPLGIAAAQCNSFLKLCDVMDLLLNANRGVTTPQKFYVANVAFLRAHLTAYGDMAWVPKHHLSMHLADQMAAVEALLGHVVLIGCNVHEIRHKLVKRWSRDRYTRNGFESGCLEEVTLQHLHDMQEPWIAVGLVNAHPPTKRLAESMSDLYGPYANVLQSRSTRVNNRVFIAGDIAAVRIDGHTEVGQMHFHVAIDGVPKTCVTIFAAAPRPSDSDWSRTYQRTHDVVIIDSACLVASLTYLESAGHVAVLMPASVRMM